MAKNDDENGKIRLGAGPGPAHALASYQRPKEPVALVIFGGAGDLTWRKVMPALYDLYKHACLPETFAITIMDVAGLHEKELLNHFHEGVKQFSQHEATAKDWREFSGHISYFKADFTDSSVYRQLSDRLAALEKKWGSNLVSIFYLATPPRFFGTIADMLGDAGLARKRRQARILLEKPIGHDLKSMRKINRAVSARFHESQIFRIDHYLGKETVRNILAFRFANLLFEPIWDRRYVDYVTITVAEQVGVENRGGYYEGAGALRDMVQNHLLQLLCLIAMEPPVSFEADEVRNKKVDVLHAIREIPGDAVTSFAVRGQYGPGAIGGKKVPGYRQEPGVAATSSTETYAALKLFVDNWRWQDVPFYLRTGKRMAEHSSEIVIHFRPVPHQSFPLEAIVSWMPVSLSLCIQPREGIVLKFQAKKPGAEVILEPVEMNFSYRQAFGKILPEAYNTLLWDLMIGDATIFMRSDQVEAAWSVLAPVLDYWQSEPPDDFPNYAAGSWGPKDAASLLARQGCAWPFPSSLPPAHPAMMV